MTEEINSRKYGKNVPIAGAALGVRAALVNGKLPVSLLSVSAIQFHLRLALMHDFRF